MPKSKGTRCPGALPVPPPMAPGPRSYTVVSGNQKSVKTKKEITSVIFMVRSTVSSPEVIKCQIQSISIILETATG